MLLDDLSRTINDPDVLRLITQWLDAGALDGCRPSAAWVSRLKSVVAGGKLALGDAIDSLLNEFVSNRLDAGLQASGGDPNFAVYSDAFAEAGGLEPPSMSPGDEQTPAASARKAAIRRLLQDGLLLGLVERGALRALLSAKLLALGGAALVAAAAAPPLIRKLSAAASRSTGAMQGSPISHRCCPTSICIRSISR